MAYLNVRDRRIETKIAYLGAAARGTSFEQLRAVRSARFAKVEAATSASGDSISVTWMPAESDRFRDCDVRVTLVSPRGSIRERAFLDVLREADGVVVLPDADSSVDAVRGVLAEADRLEVPVVVQDGEQGVAETLEVAVNQVLATMRTPGPEADTGVSAVAVAAPAEPGGHPLLEALRQVLRDTVRDHVLDLEKRLVDRLSTHLDNALARSEARATARVEATMVRLTQRVAELDVVASGVATRVDAVATRVEGVATRVEGVALRLDGVATDLEALTTSVDCVAGGLDGLRSAVVVVEKQVVNADPRARLELADAAARQRSTVLEEALKKVQAQVGQAFGSTDEKTDALTARLEEVLNELKNKKKGWFA